MTIKVDSMNPGGFWGWVGLGAEKWGKILLETSGSAFLQGIEYHSWAIEHGPDAPNNFLKHFRNAYIGSTQNKARDIAYCVHYLVDTGTPFHRKKLIRESNLLLIN